MTNSSTPSEPSNNPSSTDDVSEERGFRVRVVYPIVFEYRYAVYPNERDWRVAERSKATIFATEAEALDAVQVINEDADIKAVEGLATVEPVPSFDPDWCIAPGTHIKERMEQQGLSFPQLAARLSLPDTYLKGLMAGTVSIGERVGGKLAEVLGGSTDYWRALYRNYHEGKRMGRTEV